MKILLAAATLSLLALGIYTLAIVFSESHYTRRGTYAYWVSISKTIRNVPEVGKVTDVTFYSSAGDGPKRPANAVSYVTDAPREEVTRELTRHFERLGISAYLSAALSEESAPSSGSDPIEILIEPADSGRLKVTVTETF